MTVEEQIKDILEKEIEDYSDYFPDDDAVRIRHENDGLFALEYHSFWHNDFRKTSDDHIIFHIMQMPEYAHRISAVTITSEDAGVNGVQYWDIESLIDSHTVFDHLKVLILPMNDAESHNGKIITYKDMYDESNALGLLLNKCPALKKLVAPSAPGPLFFEREEYGLEELEIQTGFDHQDFIANLSRSTCFKNLTSFSFRDYAEDYMENYQSHCTKFDDYMLLMTSDTLPSLQSIVLFDTCIDDGQKEALIKAASAKGRTLNFLSLAED